jgi:hypothetical protein
MKCLNKAPEDRYPSAQALARELRRIRGTAPADAGSASASPPEPEVSFSDELLAIERTGQAAEPARPRKRRKSARPKTRKDRPMKPVDDDEGTDFLGLDDEAGTSAAMPPAAELPGELLSDLLDIERTGKTDDSSVEEMADVERLAPGPPAAPVVPDLELPGADEVELEPADEVEPEAAAEEVELEPVAAPGRPPATMRAHLPSVVLTSLANDQKVRLFKATNLLGRSSECDIILQAADVSKRHCQVHVAAGGVTIEDLNSVNGIQVNGRTVKRCRLKDGDRLEIAGHAFQVHVSKPKK